MLGRRYAQSGLVVLGCLLLTGCVTKSESDGGVSVHYEWWLPTLTFVGGIVAVPLGLFLRQLSGRLGWVLMIGGPIACVFFAPTLMMERVYIDDRGFESTSGIWGMTAGRQVKFDAVKSCRIEQEETGGRHSRWIEVMYFDMKSGPEVKFELNNDVKTEAGVEIVHRAVRYGLPFPGVN